MAQPHYDHFDRREKACAALGRACRLAPDNARIVYQLPQLYKNILMTVADRPAFLESREGLVRQPGDCFLEMIMLYVRQGRFDRPR